MGLALIIGLGDAGELRSAYCSTADAPRTADENRAIIRALFLAAGLPLAVAKAAEVNAQWESAGWNNRAVGDGGKSVGLFQLHENGAGRGMSVAERMDPARNTLRIIDEVRSSHGVLLLEAARAGLRLPELAAIFSRDIERPADRAGEMKRRAELAKQLYPGE